MTRSAACGQGRFRFCHVTRAQARRLKQRRLLEIRETAGNPLVRRPAAGVTPRFPPVWRRLLIAPSGFLAHVGRTSNFRETAHPGHRRRHRGDRGVSIHPPGLASERHPEAAAAGPETGRWPAAQAAAPASIGSDRPLSTGGGAPPGRTTAVAGRGSMGAGWRAGRAFSGAVGARRGHPADIDDHESAIAPLATCAQQACVRRASR